MEVKWVCPPSWSGMPSAFADPTVQFHGHRSEGFRALAVALERGLPVHTLRRIWTIDDGETDRPLLGVGVQLSPLHSAQRGLPPVPGLRFSVSMLLPVLQSELL